MAGTVERQARSAASSTGFRVAARSGFAASGIVQALVGVLAIQVAVQGGGQDADQTGAVEALAEAPGGAVVVWLTAVAGLALALWLILDGILERGADAKATWKARLKSWAKAVAYGAIGVTALRVALGSSSSSSRSSREGTATLLSLPGGQVLLGALGVVVVGLGAFLVHRGVAKKFLETIRVPSGTAGRVVTVLAQVGYAARGVAIAMVGVLFVVAAVQVDPSGATGLDGALRAFSDLPFGRTVLVLIGVGWIASGVYSVVRARIARLQ